jgi:hypothetical protein
MLGWPDAYGWFPAVAVVKTLVFAFGLLISAVGVVGLVAPSVLVSIAGHFLTPAAFYVLAAVRIAFGFVLVSVAPRSRAPRALRVLGWVVVVLGLTTALAGLTAIGPARDAIAWWVQQGPGPARLTALAPIALGGFVAWACSPDGRASG